MSKFSTWILALLVLLMCTPVALAAYTSSSGASMSGGGKWGSRSKGHSVVIVMLDDMGSDAFTMLEHPYNSPGAYSPVTGGYTSAQLPNITKLLDNGINFKQMRASGTCAASRLMLQLGNQGGAGGTPLKIIQEFDPTIRVFQYGKNILGSAAPLVGGWLAGEPGVGFRTSIDFFVGPPGSTITKTIDASDDPSLYTKNGHTWASIDDLGAMGAVEFIKTDVYGDGSFVENPDTWWNNQKAPLYIAVLGMHAPHRPFSNMSNIQNATATKSGVVYPSTAIQAHWATSQTWTGQAVAAVPDVEGANPPDFQTSHIPFDGYSGNTNYSSTTYTAEMYPGGNNLAFADCPQVDPSSYGGHPGPWTAVQMAAFNNQNTTGVNVQRVYDKAR